RGDRKARKTSEPSAEKGFWGLSIGIFRSCAEALIGSICNVREGTSTRYLKIWVSFGGRTFVA
uniref:Uncharacterized protein n=1 Tax=Neovison vison TaxID=452646 RepID=A0A8C7AIT7_NEOVI